MKLKFWNQTFLSYCPERVSQFSGPPFRYWLPAGLFAPQQLERFRKTLETALWKILKIYILHFSDFNSFLNWSCSLVKLPIWNSRSVIRESQCVWWASLCSGLPSIIETIKILGSPLLTLPGLTGRATKMPLRSRHPPHPPRDPPAPCPV